MTKTREEQIALLREAIRRSGLSVNGYARDVLIRDSRTVRRWLAGGAIPKAVLARLERHPVGVPPQKGA